MRHIKAISIGLSIFLFSINFVRGADYPLYKDQLLTIPSVSTAEQVGKYQDVVLKLTDQGLFQLLNVRSIGITEMKNFGVGKTIVTKVDALKTDTFPTQMFLRVEGVLDRCYDSRFGQIHLRRENNHFDVLFTFDSFVSLPAPPPGQGVACMAGLTGFLKTVPLPVYGLSSGIYSYRVNDTKFGTFELTAGNYFTGDYIDIDYSSARMGNPTE